VKLLFDENVSDQLVKILADVFPDSSHVRTLGLRGAEDPQIWERPERRLYNRVEDTDFRERSYVEGAPPKVVWLDVGNAGTGAIEALLRRERDRLERFEAAEEPSMLILSLGPNAI
jgi:predicted nuclease of predicted toxin-antitoxin system